MQRLAAVTNQGNLKATKDFGAGQLWVFPKSWFVTFYQFGLHYYLLFASFVWVLLGRVRALYVVVFWAIVYLAWLQFGGNPFSSSYQVKSHLERYCSMLSVPMAVLCGAFVAWLLSWRRAWGVLVLTVVIMAGLFFTLFNTLSFERQLATKVAVDYARRNSLFPLYMDRTSYAVAEIYMHDDDRSEQLHKIQDYDFKAENAVLEDLSTVDGYVLLNRGFMEYAWNRYRIERVDITGLDINSQIFSVDNPGPSIAYRQAQLLYWASRAIPVDFLRSKIGGTATALLEPEDAVIFDLRRVRD